QVAHLVGVAAVAADDDGAAARHAVSVLAHLDKLTGRRGLPLDVADDPDLRHPGGNGQAGGLARIPECVAVILGALPWYGDVNAGRRDAEIGRASQQRAPEGQKGAVEDADACGAPRSTI